MAPETLASGQPAPEPRFCACKCGKPLSGRQKRFATRPCAAREYDQQHPRVNRGPLGPRTGTAEEAAYAFMVERFGQWWTIYEMSETTRILPTTLTGVLARLRKRHYIECDSKTGNGHRVHRYRLLELRCAS